MKRKIFNLFVVAVACFTVLFTLSTLSACNPTVNIGQSSEDTPLILRYKAADAISYAPVESCPEYNSDNGVLELEIDADTRYLNLDELFKSEYNTKWVVYLDRMGTVAANTRILCDFDNGENLYYISVFTLDEVYVKTYCVNFYKNYTVNVSFVTESGKVLNIPREGNKFADSIRDREAVFNDDGTITIMGDTVLTESPEYSVNGYTFNGWFNGSAGIKNYKLTENTVFTASLTANNYEITLDCGAGSLNVGTENKKTVIFGENYTLPVPQREGYSFAGWSYKNEQTLTDGEGNSLKPMHIYDDIELSALWTVNSYGVGFKSVGENHGYVDVYKSGDEQPIGRFDPYADEIPDEWSFYANYGEKLSFKFHPEAGYSFVSMKINGMVVDTNEYVMPAKNVAFEIVWKQFTVEFVAEDERKGTLEGSGAYTEGTEVKLKANANRGYIFVEWKINGETASTDVEYTFEMPLASVKVAAVWRPVEVSLTLDYRNGSVNGSQIVKYDSEFELPVPEKSGYRFLGWYNANGVAITSNDGKSLKTSEYTEDVTLEARYAPISVTISFNYNGGTAGASSITASYGEAISLPETSLYGYVFEGWVYDEKTYNGSFTVTVDSDCTFVAKWSPVNITIILQNEPEQDIRVPAIYNQSVTLVKPTKTGYNFVGWKEKDGETVYKSNEETVVIAKSIYVQDVTLIAQWKAKSYEVTLMNENVAFRRITIDYDQTIDFTNHIPSKKGYDFLGWFDADGNEITKADGTSDKIFDYTQEVTFYAKWKAKQVVAKFDSNGATNVLSDISLTYDEEYTLPVITRTGYDFAGWFIDDKNYSALDNTKSDFEENVTFVARWTAKTYTVTYSVQSPATVSKQSSIVTYDKEEQLVIPKNVGYTFLGWYRNETAITDATGKIAKVQFTEDITVEAKWKSTVINATINPDNGTGTSTIKIKYGEPYSLSAPSAKTGYEFVGWYYNNTLVIGTNGQSLQNSTFMTDITITAKWNPVDVTISLDANGGVVSSTTVVAKYDATNVSLGVPTRTGYDFGGWKKGSTVTGANGVLSVVDFTEATFVAVWNPKEYTLTVTSEDKNKGTVTKDGRALYGSVVTLTAKPADGYAFIGWYRGNTFVTDANPYNLTIDGNNTLTAKFEQRYSIIRTASELKNIKYDGEYILGKNITLSGSWTALNFEKGFCGLLDGNGYTISGLKIDTTNQNLTDNAYFGLFTKIGSNGVVKDLTLSGTIETQLFNCDVVTRSYAAGLLTGINEGSIENCVFTGSITSKTHEGSNITVPYNSYYVGGIVGINYGSIKYSVSKVTLEINDFVHTSMYAGGLVGANKASSTVSAVLRACAVNSTVTVTNKSCDSNSYVGMVAGETAATVTDIKSVGKITVTAKSTGAEGKLNHVYAATFGLVSNGSVSRVYSDLQLKADVLGNASVAGLFAVSTSKSSVKDCFVKGSVNVAVTRLDGIGTVKAGYVYADSKAEFDNSYYDSSLTITATRDNESYAKREDANSVATKQATSDLFGNTLGFKTYQESATESGCVWYLAAVPKLFIE